MRKAVFFDRDGVLNVERGTYTFRPQDFEVMDGAPDLLQKTKRKGFHSIVVTNQAGIAKGLYTQHDVESCHEKLQEATDNAVDEFYIAPDHPDFSMSLSRKPDSLMFERAIAKFDLDPKSCWMIGDKERDLFPAKKLGIGTILVGQAKTESADYVISHLKEAVSIIFESN